MSRTSLIVLFSALLAAPATAAPTKSLTPEAVAARTPPPDRWGVAEFDLSDYFSHGELSSWREHRGRHRLVNSIALVADLLLYVLLLTGVGRRLRAWANGAASCLGRAPPARWPLVAGLGRALARAWGGSGWAGAMLFAYIYFALGVAVDLPASLWHELISRQAGLSNYTPWGWTADFVKSLLLGSLLFSMLVFGVYGLVRRFPGRWWAMLAVPSGIALVGYGVLSPYQTRVFHDVVPLAQHAGHARAAELSRGLEGLARARGVSLRQIKVVRSSRTSKALNAYLDGLGPSRELVLFDTLLQQATPAEVLAVVAHELGHLTRQGALRTYLLGALGLTMLLWLFSVALRFGARRMGLAGPGDVGTLPVMGLTALLAFNLALPLSNLRSRRQELLADREALVLTGDPDAFISLQVKLARRDRADVAPGTWVKLWLFSHPPISERIGQALWYRRWLKGRSAGGGRTNFEPCPINKTPRPGAPAGRDCSRSCSWSCQDRLWAIPGAPHQSTGEPHPGRVSRPLWRAWNASACPCRGATPGSGVTPPHGGPCGDGRARWSYGPSPGTSSPPGWERPGGWGPTAPPACHTWPGKPLAAATSSPPCCKTPG